MAQSSSLELPDHPTSAWCPEPKGSLRTGDTSREVLQTSGSTRAVRCTFPGLHYYSEQRSKLPFMGKKSEKV